MDRINMQQNDSVKNSLKLKKHNALNITVTPVVEMRPGPVELEWALIIYCSRVVA